MAKNALIIHGHFYQPPREDPWTGEVPMQESAFPFHDWNARITQECYAANCFSRALDPDGRIFNILNNYSVLSFNIGPTLMNWLKTKAPNVYEQIIYADKISVKANNGHGNAIAQVYNHMIMPLATRRDQITQIRWGLEDFRAHFGRDAEGIWLAETAINNDTAEILVNEGVKFTILSPWQGASFTNKKGEYTDLVSHPAPSDRPFYLETPSGNLAVFFYNNILAQGVSFEHYLHNADFFHDKILNFHRPDADHLINFATDGEIYGHHEAFGDMCLAALSLKLKASDKFYLTNYGAFLESNPPTETVQLRPGEAGKGTSWSCFHGVSRWYKDCGCSTGGQAGWNQKWRTPLKEGLDALALRLEEIYRRQMQKLTDDEPDDIRNRYISILTGLTSHEDFFFSCHPKDPETREVFYQLLEGQKYAMFMMTSCGWFFSDVTGIETIQNLAYAVKAIRLYGSFTSENLSLFLGQYLAHAVSNQSHTISGKTILNELEVTESSTPNAACVFIIRKILSRGSTSMVFGFYRVLQWDEEESYTNAIYKRFSGRLTIRDSSLGRIKSFAFILNDYFDKKIEVLIKDLSGNRDYESFPLEDLPLNERKIIVKRFSRDLFIEHKDQLENFFTTVKSAFSYSETLKTGLDASFKTAAVFYIENYLLARFEVIEAFAVTQNLEDLTEMLTFIRKNSLSPANPDLKKYINSYFNREIEMLMDSWDAARITVICALLDLFREANLSPDVMYIQNQVFLYLRNNPPKDDPNLDQSLETIGTWLGMNIPKIRKSIEESIRLR
jgi:hypothetical protein